MRVLLQINGAQRVWIALLNPESKNLQSNASKQKTCQKNRPGCLPMCSIPSAMPRDSRDGEWTMGDFTEQSEAISKFSAFPAPQFS